MQTFDMTHARRWSLAGAFLVAAFSLTLPGPSEAQNLTSLTPQERADVQVVLDWFAAWELKDPEKVASYMGENVEFRPVPDQAMGHGRAEFVKREQGLLNGGPKAQVSEVHAIGGATGTNVLIKRTDVLNMNGQSRVVGPFAAFFRVNNGKIQEWLDIPLVAMSGQGPAPGAGGPAPSAGGPAPSAPGGR